MPYSTSSKRIALSTSLCLALMLASVTPSLSQTGSQRIDGRNCTEVDAGDRIYKLTPFARWIESGKGPSYEFVEERRDEWSVYLLDGSRDVRLQLDLKGMQVYYSEGKGPKSPLYNMMSAGADITAKNVTVVKVNNGEYRMTGPGRWDEATGGGTFTFAESKRDATSVYLTDASRGVKMQLDLGKKQVFYAEDNGKPRPLYPITGVSAISWQ